MYDDVLIPTMSSLAILAIRAITYNTIYFETLETSQYNSIGSVRRRSTTSNLAVKSCRVPTINKVETCVSGFQFRVSCHQDNQEREQARDVSFEACRF